MNHGKKCENGCALPATWRCEHLFFCENCKEGIIRNVGIDRYQWERLSEDEDDFSRTAHGVRRRWGCPAITRARMVRAHATSKFEQLAGIRRIPDKTNPRGYREVCVTTTAWENRRAFVYERDNGRCRRCGCLAPLHGRLLTPLEPGLPPTAERAGEAMHIAARKAGGGFRDDHPTNLLWGCATCHRLDPTCKFLQQQREEVFA